VNGAVFRDRVDAGRRLGHALRSIAGPDIVVLGLPRGGVPVAGEVAGILRAPLDVILVRKLGLPGRPELAMGAIGEDGVRVLNRAVLEATGTPNGEVERVERAERAELERRAARYRGGRPRLDLAGRTALVVDDGIATGSTARAAGVVARAHGAARVVLAVPVAPPGWEADLAGAADDFFALATPEPFYAVGQFYADFGQTSDREVERCLAAAFRPPSGPDAAAAQSPDPSAPGPRDDEVQVVAPGARLAGRLVVPPEAVGVVVFAHGSGSSRFSPRNRYVAAELNRSGLGTLLVDLLTPAEEPVRARVFDVDLLAARLAAVTAWLRGLPGYAAARVGYFGASTGAAAALSAAGLPGAGIGAVVCRGGRVDLSGSRLVDVTAPTLLIVGGDDRVVLDLNRRTQRLLRCENRLTVVPGAGHLFEEPGALEAVAGLAAEWFVEHLGAHGGADG
jgi:putative phosphoribosyl transferase